MTNVKLTIGPFFFRMRFKTQKSKIIHKREFQKIKEEKQGSNRSSLINNTRFKNEVKDSFELRLHYYETLLKHTIRKKLLKQKSNKQTLTRETKFSESECHSSKDKL